MSSRQVSDYALDRQKSAIQVKQTGHVEPPTDGDFKSFVLYVHSPSKRTPLCFKALEVLTDNSAMKKDTLILDFDGLQSRPTWLEDAPCLVIKADRKALKGDAAIQYIQSHVQKGAVKYSKRSSLGHLSKKKSVW